MGNLITGTEDLMNYSYEFVEVSPKQLFVQVRYFKEDHPDIFRNIIVSEFTEEALDLAVQAYAKNVIETWESIERAPETLELSSSIKSAVYVAPEEEPLGMVTIQDPEPEFDFYTQKLERTYEETETEARHGWAVSDLTEEERSERLELGKQSMRQERDRRLKETDHWLLADTPNPSQAHLDYRQALRDVPSQAGFPANIIWPTKP